MKIFDQLTTDSVTSVVQNCVGTAIDVRKAGSVSIVTTYTVDANAAANFNTSAIGTNTITLPSHGYKTGIVGQCTTNGALPTGLSTSTNYYVIVIDINTISVATSQANAFAGTAVTFTASGASGTGTFTPTALSGASIQSQWSLDGNTWIDDGTTIVSTSGSIGTNNDRPPYAYYRRTYAIASGSLTVATTYLVNRDS